MAAEAEATAAAVTIAPWIGPSLTAGAILVSALGVAFMIWTHWAIARRRAILDFIVTQQTDDDYLAARRRFVKLKQDGDMVKFAGKDQVASDEATDIRFILNMYEVVAIGIKKNAYDEEMYRDWWRTTTVKDWIACKDFVAQCQQELNPKIYTGFEMLAKGWATSDEQKHV